MQSTPERLETPPNLPLPLIVLFKALVLMPRDHTIVVPVEDATFGLPLENMYVLQFSRMVQISSTCIVVYMK